MPRKQPDVKVPTTWTPPKETNFPVQPATTVRPMTRGEGDRVLSELCTDQQAWGEMFRKRSATETMAPAISWYLLGRSDQAIFTASRLREYLNPTVTSRPSANIDLNAVLEALISFIASAQPKPKEAPDAQQV